MYKRILSFALASAMALSMGANALAATANPIAQIDENGYAYDSDASGVDLNNPNPDFAYGDTVYYPLLNEKGTSGNEAVANAQNELTIAQTAKDEADEAFEGAKATAAEKVTAVSEKEALKVKAEAVLAAANDWKTAVDNSAADVADKQAAYNLAFAEFDDVNAPAEDANTAVTGATAAVSTATDEVNAANGEKTTADEDVLAKEADVAAKAAIVTEKQDALNAVLNSNFKYIYESDAVKSVKIKQEWSMNKNFIDSVEIVKKKAVTSMSLEHKYIYFLSVNLKDSSSTKEADITGTISLRKSGDFDYEDCQVEIALTVGFPESEDNIITSDTKIFSDGNGLSSDSEDELTFDVDEDSYFTVNTIGQGKILLAMDAHFDNDIATRFPTANLDFLNGNGASFNKIGIFTMSAPKDSFIYRINNDGSLTLINATYDEYEEAYTFKTRTLDRYVISDVELKGTGSVISPEDGNEGGSTNNPSTGAIL